MRNGCISRIPEYQPIGSGGTLAAFCAEVAENIRQQIPTTDIRFPDGINNLNVIDDFYISFVTIIYHDLKRIEGRLPSSVDTSREFRQWRGVCSHGILQGGRGRPILRRR